MKISNMIFESILTFGIVVISVVVLAISQNEHQTSNIYISLILGVSITTAVYSFRAFTIAKNTRLHGLKHEAVDIEYIQQTDIEETVTQLYKKRNCKIYATHIDYQDDVITMSEDWASFLYDGTSSTPFKRIVHCCKVADYEWVEEMLCAKKDGNNPNFSFAVVEDESSTVPYPNFIVVKSEDSCSTCFVSYRSIEPDGSHSLGALIKSDKFAEKLINHFEHFFERSVDPQYIIERRSSCND